jgi:hypothetical protein
MSSHKKNPSPEGMRGVSRMRTLSSARRTASDLAPASRRTGCCGFAGPGPPPLWIRSMYVGLFAGGELTAKRRNVSMAKAARPRRLARMACGMRQRSREAAGSLAPLARQITVALEQQSASTKQCRPRRAQTQVGTSEIAARATGKAAGVGAAFPGPVLARPDARVSRTRQRSPPRTWHIPRATSPLQTPSPQDGPAHRRVLVDRAHDCGAAVGRRTAGSQDCPGGMAVAEAAGSQAFRARLDRVADAPPLSRHCRPAVLDGALRTRTQRRSGETAGHGSGQRAGRPGRGPHHFAPACLP